MALYDDAVAAHVARFLRRGRGPEQRQAGDESNKLSAAQGTRQDVRLSSRVYLRRPCAFRRQQWLRTKSLILLPENRKMQSGTYVSLEVCSYVRIILIVILLIFIIMFMNDYFSANK